jgi:hypothetical protein
MRIVPAELRAQVQLPASAGGARAFPVFLSSAAGFEKNASGGDWISDLRARYAREFGAAEQNATLLVIGGDDFAAGTPNLAAYLPPPGTGGKGTGPVSTYTVQPGYDDAASRPVSAAGGGAAPTAARIQERRNGETYKQAWEAALQAGARWVVIDSWNDFARGTEVAASRQYGPRYLDLTRIFALQFNGLPARGVKWLRHNVPARLRPLQVAAAEIVVANEGVTPLRGEDGFALTYRWLRNGQVVAESPLRVRVPGTLFPTQTARIPLGIAAARVQAPLPVPERGRTPAPPPSIEPLPPGDYVLQVDMTQAGADNKPIFFGENGDRALSVPVTIVADLPDRVIFDGTTMPRLVQSGANYPVSVRLRWLGRDPLPPGSAVLTYQLESLDGSRTLVTGSVTVLQTIGSGQATTVRANVRLSDPGGSAIPAAYPESGGATPPAYRLRWFLTRANSTESVTGAWDEMVSVYPDDLEARLLVDPGKTPVQSMEAGALVPIALTVVNNGPTRWTRGLLSIGYHWYFPDGVEAQWRPPITVAVDRDVEPGRSVRVTVPVRMPERDGEYILASMPCAPAATTGCPHSL